MEFSMENDFIDIPQNQIGLFSPDPFNNFVYKEDDSLGVACSEEAFKSSFDRIFSSTPNLIKNNDTIANVEQKKETNIKKGNKITDINIKTTAENTVSNKIMKNKRKMKKEKMGRKKKGESIKNIKGVKQNNKYREDNVRLRYKRAFLNSLIDFINSKIDKCPKLAKKGKLQKLLRDIVEKTKKENTLIMLNTSAREYLSNNISTKCKTLTPDHNKKLIDYIYAINETSITKILDKSIIDLMIIFNSYEIEDNDFKDFKRLQYYIDNELIEVYNEENDYIELFKYQAENYQKEIENLKGRYETLKEINIFI
jgi:vacuolar-type H+-ATPase subunit E/Vma4